MRGAKLLNSKLSASANVSMTLPGKSALERVNTLLKVLV